MLLEIPSHAGMVRIRTPQWSARDRTSTPFRMQENMTAWWECWEAWKRSGRYNRVDFVRSILLNFSFSPLKSRRDLESVAWEAGCCRDRFLRTQRENSQTMTARRWTRFAAEPALRASSQM